MPKWLDLDNKQIWKALNPFLGPSVIPWEHSPLTDSEQDIGLRIFKGDGKIHAKDLDSGTIGSEKTGGEALDDLRSKMKTS